jgi:hypothetical protein
MKIAHIKFFLSLSLNIRLIGLPKCKMQKKKKMRKIYKPVITYTFIHKNNNKSMNSYYIITIENIFQLIQFTIT